MNGKHTALALMGPLALSLGTGCALVRTSESPELVLKGSVAESSEVVSLDPVFVARQKQAEERFFGLPSASEAESKKPTSPTTRLPFPLPGSGSNESFLDGSLPEGEDSARAELSFGEGEDDDLTIAPGELRPLPNGYKTLALGLPMHLGTFQLSSPFGYRGGRLHAGTDFRAPKGTPIYAAADGQILISRTWKAYGQAVVLGHDNDFSTLYAHMSRIAAREGGYVKAGDLLGYVGRTGRATGNHLHFETRVAGGIPQDPMLFLPNTRDIRWNVSSLGKIPSR